MPSYADNKFLAPLSFLMIQYKNIVKHPYDINYIIFTQIQIVQINKNKTNENVSLTCIHI